MPQHSRKKKTTLLVSTVLAGSLFLSGCGSSGQEENADQLSGVAVTQTEDSFTAELENPVDSGDVATRIIEEGDGDDIELGELLKVSTLVFDANTGDAIGPETPTSQVMDVSEAQMEQNPELFEMISSTNVGSIVAFHVPGEQIGTENGQILVIKLEEKVPLKAEGEVQDLPEEFPVITDGEDNVPELESAPEGDAPEDTESAVRKQGAGDKVGEDDILLVNYIGYKWSDGEMFDSSYEREAPAAFGLNQVVAGWKKGLAGKYVGDQVVVIVPPKDGYGESEGHELEKETLIFVVDILYAEPEEEPAQQ